ncbi:MAG: hypothetical protein K0R38_1127 [Polyangiaceae bacterium]|nr:hypothetical protein [Polyangiaceae bacterium]
MSESDKPAPDAQPAAPQTVRPKAPRASVRPRRPVEEETPVIGGRFLTAAAIIGAATLLPLSCLGQKLEPREPPTSAVSEWKVGGKSTLRITLVTADYAGLACAYDKEFEGKHCANKTETEAWPRDPNAPIDDNKANVVQPYRTWNDNRLVMVAGLWATPALATRLHIEPPGNLLPEKLARFVTECQVRFVGQMEQPKLRWGQTASYTADPTTKQVMVAVPDSCKLIPEPSEPCPSGVICGLLTRL